MTVHRLPPRSVAACLALAGLAACAPVSVYYKAGVPVAKSQSDLTDCRVIAVNKVPARPVVRVIPGLPLPPRKVCDGKGNCHMIPGRRTPPEIVTEDANDGLRADVVAQCMNRQGYVHMTLPNCSESISKAVTPQQTTVFPRLTKNACVVRKGKVWQIVTPG
ncbi:hypothetical protein U5922_006580 [Aquicoccus sp. G2-2]|uniref:hypothetical protein n=1 Tax=Aquicoccus sp. G2-2 TaxID=3092120 RepID=UPI002ADFA19C|nr:hypothetical protein [Aquicoccus sp. G2-2]MEA1113153.1 hypothetical protein [Aquicoccus sp. G2-2]